ncbi:MAG: PIG-L deacetylase family protein [Tumebacillaceae bacterium]
MRGSHKGSRAFGSLLLLGGLLLANSVTHHADAELSHGTRAPSGHSTALQQPLPAPPKRLLVVVPHPDDASLGGTAMIDRTLQSGGSVKLAVMTSGDGFRLAATRTFGISHPTAQDLYRLGLVRQQEELASARQLGLSSDAVQFLGYPDGGMHHLWSSSHWTAQTAFHASNGFDHVPYPRAYHQGAPYCGQAVVDDLRALIATFQPTDVLYPDPHDIHNDHWATSAFMQFVLGGMRQPPNAWTYLIHYPDFPTPRSFRPQFALQPPAAIADFDCLNWFTLPLRTTLQDAKKRAILSHKTQINVMGDLLLSFVRTNDLIGRYTPPTIRETSDAASDPFAASNAMQMYRVVRDPVWDEEKAQHVASADIQDVAMVRSGGRLHVCVEYMDDVRPDLDYWVRIRQPGLATAAQRNLDLHIRDGKLSYNPLQFPATRADLPVVTLRPRRLMLTLPDALFRQTDKLMISTETLQNQRLIDKSAWQTLHVQTFPSP